jgi:hypothetical protein
LLRSPIRIAGLILKYDYQSYGLKGRQRPCKGRKAREKKKIMATSSVENIMGTTVYMQGL